MTSNLLSLIGVTLQLALIERLPSAASSSLPFQPPSAPHRQLLNHLTPPSFLDGATIPTFQIDEGDVPLSTKCKKRINEYASCQTTNAIFLACSQRVLLNDSKIESFLGCKDSSKDPDVRAAICRKACLDYAKVLINRTITGSCDPTIQAMQGFSASISLFEVGKLNGEKNFSESLILPFPNVKGSGGISMIDFGHPGKCPQVPDAQYCVIAGQMSTGGMPISFSLGQCLPDSCSQDELETILHQISGSEFHGLNLRIQCGLVERVGEALGMSKQIQDVLGWGGVPVKYPRVLELTPGFWLTVVVTLIFAILVVSGTAMHWRRESKERAIAAAGVAPSSLQGEGLETAQPLNIEVPLVPQLALLPMTAYEKFLSHWSVLRNGRSFLRTRTGDNNPFACMDAIRTLSMGQVILGHMYVYSLSSSGLANMEQFNPPNGMLGSVWFMIIPGCFYGVDSFFLLSGFLCCYSLQRKVFNRAKMREAKGFCLMYPKFAFLRVLRLLPTEMLCIALCVNVLPFLGTGILWNLDRPAADGSGGVGHCFDAAGSAECSTYWWTNLLFLQDLNQYNGKCFGHTWYLANDMQLYLTAPFFCLAYSYRPKLGWACISAGLLVGVISPMVIAAQLNIVPETLLSTGGDYMKYIYTKPYCRCTPFFVGIALSWLWQEKLEAFNFRHVTMKGRLVSYAFSFLGLGLCGVATFARVVFYQCDLEECMNLDTNPGGKIGLFLWAGFSILAWSLGLGIIMILCFQKRFLPLISNFLDLPGWQPFAKLSYAAYLIHTSVLIMDYCQLSAPLQYTNAGFFFKYIAFVTVTMAAAFCLHILLEKPIANWQMALFQMSGE